MIKPTVGRVVWFTPSKGPSAFMGPDFLMLPGDQPCAAMVTYVWNDRLVNLVVFDHYGKSFGKTSVQLVQDNDALPPAGYFAEWMPYQVGQAKKNEPANPGTTDGLNPHGAMIGNLVPDANSSSGQRIA